MNQRVTLDIVDDAIAIVSLNRPDKYNGLDLAMFEGIVGAAKKIRKNKKIRAVILRGEGDVFSSGLDVKSIMSSPVAITKLLVKPGVKISNLAQDVALVWRQLPVPVIAVTHGVCFGGAFQIVLGADFRYTSKDCQFSIMEGKHGLIPDMSGSVTLRELVSIDVAKELTMTARIFEAPEAKELGIVTKVCEQPFDEAISFAKLLCEKSAPAVNSAKRLFNETWVASEKEALNLETKLQLKILGKKFAEMTPLKHLLK
ncbi:MAG: crotonase/enoyl-CoA hydratase family protein [Hahellaceae bacterium]|jgi:enoyl-CoA hydratase/carnithine racemase|nr:crotonase/enoyl-CoA hydratase family protein [Hahellaceae bacterium]MCP5212117.1 crotonase/enoyl-CoA hydratase family protein [Hahellaceae bacterium]